MQPSLPVEVELLVDEEGNLSFIYDEALAALFADDTDDSLVTMNRASRVEPAGVGTKFTADMALSNGPHLGTFDTYKQAVAAEVAWLKGNVFNA